MSRPGSTTSRVSSESRRCSGCGDFRLPRWRCRTTRTSPSSSSRHCATAATRGCWSRSTAWSVRKTATVQKKHLPHRLVCTNSEGKSAEIIALIKTQGSDTKLVAQMQPLYEARSLSRWELAGKSVPPLVTQIADGENGGVMMNEFPGKFQDTVREASGSDTPFMNGTEYLEYLFASGIKPSDLPVIQPIHQKVIWDKMKPGAGPEKLAKAIEECKREDRFHMEGGSWTNNISGCAATTV